MALKQMQRSELRKSLQTVFSETVVSVVRSMKRPRNIAARYERAWPLVLAMVGLRSTGESNDLTAKQILQRMKKKNLIFNGKGDKTTFQHHQLFKDTEKISEKAIIVGYGCLSDTSLGSKFRTHGEKYYPRILAPVMKS